MSYQKTAFKSIPTKQKLLTLFRPRKQLKKFDLFLACATIIGDLSKAILV